MRHNKLEVIVSKLREARLDVLMTIILDPAQIQSASTAIRGGKWDKGPYPVSGGPPAAMIVCYDYHPKPPSSAVLKTHPYVKNENVLVKHAIRDYLNQEMLLFFHTNCIHSADDEAEAWLYLENVLPSRVDQIRREVYARRDAYKTGYPVLHLYDSIRSRAKIELIEFRGQRAVKKTFKVGMERFAEREAFAYRTFSRLISTVPPLLEQGPNYVIIPWFENLLEGVTSVERHTLIRSHADSVLQSMRTVFEQGYALIGFHPGNLLITPENDLKLIDFEFLYEYESRPETFSESYDIVGIPRDFDGDLPRGLPDEGHTFANTWLPIFGDIPIND